MSTPKIKSKTLWSDTCGSLASLSDGAIPQKLEDFGEKIAGARKDLWQGAAASSRPGENAPVTLATQLPEPDYQQAVANGTPWENLAALKAIRDAFPGMPRRPYALEDWLGKAACARVVFGLLLAGTATGRDVIHRWILVAGNRFDLYLKLGFPAFLSARAWRVATGITAAGRDATFAVLGGKIMASAEGWGEEAKNEMVGFIREQIAVGETKPARSARPVAFSVYTNRKTGDLYIGKMAGGEIIPLKTGFGTPTAAFQYIEDNRAELEAAWKALKEPACRRAANDPRRGPARRDGDATPEAFLQKFGFRGVQFGNWVENDRRRRDLNDAHDALTDLAEAVGIPVAALGFGGKLGLAFGARGKGKAMAHYEPGLAVINLTKTAGPGCLAHEWFHALDNLSQIGSEEKAAFATANGDGAFRDLTHALSAGTFAARSRRLDAIRSKRYFGKIEELAARAFEKYVIGKLDEAGDSNDYLANINVDSRAYPTAEEMENGITRAFDALFATLKQNQLAHFAAPQPGILLCKTGKTFKRLKPVSVFTPRPGAAK